MTPSNGKGLSRTSILRSLKRRAGDLKAFGVRRIGLFGSYARQTPRPRSDVDILVELTDESVNFDNYMGLLFYLEDLFKKRVDLVMVQDIKPHFREAILQEVAYA
jgi:predicted nucleotidyltransferase